MTESTPPSSRPTSAQTRRSWPTVIFGLLAVVLAIAAIIVFQRERDQAPTVVIPTAPAGENTLIQVSQSLEAAGLEVGFPARTVSARPLGQPGQELTANGTPLWVFIYPEVALREAAQEQVDASDTPLAVTTASGQVVAEQPPVIIAHSNIVVLVSTDDGEDPELIDTIRSAVEGLP